MQQTTNIKVIYSLRVNLALQSVGLKPVTEMKSPKNPKYNCWVYEKTPEFLKAFEKLAKEGGGRK